VKFLQLGHSADPVNLDLDLKAGLLNDATRESDLRNRTRLETTMSLTRHFIQQLRLSRKAAGVTLGCFLLIALSARADTLIYTDSLQNDWQDWSNPTNVANWQSTAYVHSGSYAAAVNPPQFIIGHAGPFDIMQFASLDFWINGGAAGGQIVGVQVIAPTSPIPPSYFFDPLTANTWQHVSVPLNLVSADPNQFIEFLFLTAFSQPVPTYYIDDIKLVSVPEPASVTLFGAGLLGAWIFRKKWSRRAPMRH